MSNLFMVIADWERAVIRVGVDGLYAELDPQWFYEAIHKSFLVKMVKNGK